jgi:hypothetical protein
VGVGLGLGYACVGGVWGVCVKVVEVLKFNNINQIDYLLYLYHYP